MQNKSNNESSSPAVLQKKDSDSIVDEITKDDKDEECLSDYNDLLGLGDRHLDGSSDLDYDENGVDVKHFVRDLLGLGDYYSDYSSYPD